MSQVPAFTDIIVFRLGRRPHWIGPRTSNGPAGSASTVTDTFGPNDQREKLFNLLNRLRVTGETISMSPGNQFLDPIYIDDVCDAFLVALKRLQSGQVKHSETYSVCSDNPIQLKELVKIYEKVSNIKLNVEWGGRRYRAREVMRPWSGGVTLPGWSPKEQYYTISKKGVLRGMHFQTPPREHNKLVYCTSGIILDVVLDLRIGSPSYLKHFSLNLSEEMGNILYLPAGLAHGFYSLTEATVSYNVSTVYAAEFDSGILWNSIGMTWPNMFPEISERDSKFSALENFQSPFKFV